MIQDLRKRIFIIGSIAVLVILVGVLLWLALRASPNKSLPRASQAPTTGADTRPPTTNDSPVTPRQDEDPEDVYLKQLAEIFVERFGSYSNQNENRHLEDVLLLVTPRMKSFVETQREDFQKEYTGVTTRVVAVRIEKKSATTATIRLDVQRVTVVGGVTKTTYDSGTVLLVHGVTDSDWKVDGVYWE